MNESDAESMTPRLPRTYENLLYLEQLRHSPMLRVDQRLSIGADL